MVGSFLLAASLLFASEVELYIDWRSDMKGNALFDEPFYRDIKEGLISRGVAIKSWDREKERPFLLTWRGVHSWRDFVFFAAKSRTDKKKVVFWNLGPYLRDLSLKGLGDLTLFQWEPPIVQPELYEREVESWFSVIYTWDDKRVDGVKYKKFFLPYYSPRGDVVPFEEKKFCTLIASRLASKHPQELYSERENVIRFFEDKEGVFDLYGRFWAKRKYKNYRGEIPDKKEVLRRYKFAFAYENSKGLYGYITEKLFDCLSCGVVPIYWGAENVTDYIPADIFIDRRKFKDHEELLAFLTAMTEEEYNGYVERAGAFLETDSAKRFSHEAFISLFINSLTTANPSS